MREIITREEKEKKENRNKIIIGIILVALMVLSTAGYAFFQTTDTGTKNIKYNNIDFVFRDDGLWHATMQNNELSTSYNPQDTENISVSTSLNLASYKNNPLYFSYDSDRQAIQEITRNIAGFADRVQYACLNNCSEDFPVKTCADNIILVKESNETLIKQENNCIYILTKSDDILRASDAFIFKILGI